jgi:hypothetical protein
MTKISYKVNTAAGGVIFWAAAEQFDELVGKRFYLGQMEAAVIENMSTISVTAKILLSAVAGAVIQRLLDDNIKPEAIFSDGQFQVEALDG